MIGGLCCVAADKIETKIGFLVVSGNDGKIMDDFNFEKYDQNVVTKVLQIRPATPTAFNALLLNSFRQKFSRSQAGVKVSRRRGLNKGWTNISGEISYIYYEILQTIVKGPHMISWSHDLTVEAEPSYIQNFVCLLFPRWLSYSRTDSMTPWNL